MSQLLFGLFSGKVGKKRLAKANKIAGRHDCYVVANYEDAPGQGNERGWICGPNLGQPFDDALKAEVLGELEAEGLWPLPKKVETPRLY